MCLKLELVVAVIAVAHVAAHAHFPVSKLSRGGRAAAPKSDSRF